jgi:hypothetical protein
MPDFSCGRTSCAFSAALQHYCLLWRRGGKHGKEVRPFALWHNQKLFFPISTPFQFPPDRNMLKTLYDKLWESHVVHTEDDGTAILYIDRHLLHEVTSPQAFEGLKLAGRNPGAIRPT